MTPEAGPRSKPFFEPEKHHFRPSPPSSVPPTNKIRGTESLIQDLFSENAMAQVGDPELVKDMLVLFPPAQPLPPRWDSCSPRPLWGLSPAEGVFFDTKNRPSYTLPDSIHENVARFHQLKHQGTHFNQSLMENRSFNNPHVYSQLVEFLGIDETRSNLPSLDTGRKEGSWRATFPLSDEDLIRGDPIAAEQRQEREAKERLEGKKRAGLDRSIGFEKGRYEDGSKREGKRRSSTSHSASHRKGR